MEKIFNHPSLGPITLRKRTGSRSVRISVHPRRGVLVSLPWFLPYSRALAFVEEKKEWISEALTRQKEKFSGLTRNGMIISSPSSPKEIAALRKAARSSLIPAIEAFALQYGFTDSRGIPVYNRIAVKNNVSNWGSCSSKNNINLNMRLLLIPEHLRRYVLLHELCHLKHHDHGPQFHKLLDTLCEGKEKALSRELRQYRLV